MSHFADRLIEGIRRRRTPLCVGLDPRWELLPLDVRSRHGEGLAGKARAYDEFCCRVLDVVAPLVAVVKPQSAFFEACGAEGVRALQWVVRRARQRGLIVILDGKRNDIASTAEAYAEAAFTTFAADALTVNPYLGRDAVEPFIQQARSHGGGLFILVRTSNPGAGQFQDLMVDRQPLHCRVASAVAAWSGEHVGSSGYGDVGGVVGAVNRAELRQLREHMPQSILLVPGYGAQGGSAADTSDAFHPTGLGAVVNSSRAILYAGAADEASWEAAVERAARNSVDELARHTPAGNLVLHSIETDG